MNKHQATDRDGFSRPLPQPIVLTQAETEQVAGGGGGTVPTSAPTTPRMTQSSSGPGVGTTH
jgi:hypothetical protein